MAKLIIQIPCYNEEATLGIALQELPRSVPGFDCVEWLIINDGSRDRTIEVARSFGVDHVVDLQYNRGLARAFSAGLDACLALGADVIVNTDADNQYQAKDIPLLTQPVLSGEADMVIGARPILSIDEFSPLKKLLQRLGSWVVRSISGADVADAPSGFRAISRDLALRLKVFNGYTYTLETIIQASQSGARILSVPIRVNGKLRESRLMRSIPQYIRASLITMFRIYILYRPFRVFTFLSVLPLASGSILTVRWLLLNWFEYAVTGRTHLPSLVIAVLLLGIGVALLLAGILADILAANRRLLEELRYNNRLEHFSSFNQGFAKSGK
jgi:glycosyltransferase involved in cell wall biosynthesis